MFGSPLTAQRIGPLTGNRLQSQDSTIRASEIEADNLMHLKADRTRLEMSLGRVNAQIERIERAQAQASNEARHRYAAESDSAASRQLFRGTLFDRFNNQN